MNDTKINLRLAVNNDLDQLTDLHCTSFKPEDHVPVMLGRRYVRATYKWLLNYPDSYVIVSESDRNIVGLVAVCDKPFTKPMFKACLGEFIESIFSGPKLLFNKKLWSRLFRSSELNKKGEQIAQYPGMAQMTIGVVDEKYRGEGVFPALIEATKSFSKDRNSRAIRAGVYKTNKPCRRVFEKGMWIETPELETTDTVFYVSYLDPEFPRELGIVLPK